MSSYTFTFKILHKMNSHRVKSFGESFLQQSSAVSVLKCIFQNYLSKMYPNIIITCKILLSSVIITSAGISSQN